MRALLLLALALVLGCAGGQGAGDCLVATYQDQGVAITYLRPAFVEVRPGSTVDLYTEYQNLGEAVAKNIFLYDGTPTGLGTIIERDDLSDSNSEIFEKVPRLLPPDPDRCIPGEIEKPDKMHLHISESAQPTKEGRSAKVRLVYEYSTSAWSDILTMDEGQWLVRREKDTLPQTFEWVSAAPVKVHLTVPQAPITDDRPFVVKVYFTNAIGGEAYPTTEGKGDAYCLPQLLEDSWAGELTAELLQQTRTKNCIETVEITLPNIFEYAPDSNSVRFEDTFKPRREKKDAGGDAGTLKLTLKGVSISDDPNNPHEYYFRFKLKEAPTFEEMYKIRVDAEYTFRTEYETAEKLRIIK